MVQLPCASLERLSKTMGLSSGKKYLRKSTLLVKWLFLPFGLDITGTRGTKIQKRIDFVVFLFFALCYVTKAIYRVTAFVFYVLSLSPDMRQFASAVLLVAPTALAFVTHVFLYIRRRDIWSSLKNIILLLGTSLSYSQKQYRYLAVEISLIMLLHVLDLIGDQINISTDRAGVEHACYYFMRPRGCNTFWARIILHFVNLFHVITNVFLSLSYCFFAHICHLLALYFTQIGGEIHEKIETAGIVYSNEISELKKKFQRGKKLTNGLSNVFSPIILIWWIYSIFSICMGVRVIMDIKLERCYRLILPVIDAIRLFVLYKNESDIHRQAKSVTEFFATLMPAKGDENAFNNFYFLLKSSDVGINVSGLFLITPGSILNVVATIITYAVVLFQTE